jgi:hypothetical protein
MDVILNGNASGAHTALNQTIADLQKLRTLAENLRMILVNLNYLYLKLQVQLVQ